jgi:putative chitinase
MEITQDQLQQIIPTNTHVDQWCAALNLILPKYSIDTVARAGDFIGQCAHESANFTQLTENLNYSAQGLANTWPKRFAVLDSAGNPVKPYAPTVLAKRIERNPEIIANNVYANRMGNGGPDSGDGWRYHGRGLIQLTGCANYTAFGLTINMTPAQVVDYAQTFEGAVESACWFWGTNKLNQYADSGDIETMTRRINGGTNGLDDRIAKCNLAQQILGA